jgi:hypothetical protein
MKNPVLHIKKGVERYIDPPPGSEQEPPRQGPLGTRPPQRKTVGPARRRGRFTYLPLLILALALVIVFRVVPRLPTNRATLMGWDVMLRAMPHQEAGPGGDGPVRTLLVSVTFIERSRPAGSPGGGQAPRAAARFVLPETGEELSLSEDLLKSPTTLHGQLRYDPRIRKVLATVSVGPETRTLSLTARKVQ